MSKVDTWFLITVNEDGTLTSYAEMPKDLPEAVRPANNYDVYQAAKQIVEDFEQTLLANRIASVISKTLNPTQPSMSDKIKDKLKERGIDPESATPTE